MLLFGVENLLRVGILKNKHRTPTCTYREKILHLWSRIFIIRFFCIRKPHDSRVVQ